jgi:hypothetical protein
LSFADRHFLRRPFSRVPPTGLLHLRNRLHLPLLLCHHLPVLALRRIGTIRMGGLGFVALRLWPTHRRTQGIGPHRPWESAS